MLLTLCLDVYLIFPQALFNDRSTGYTVQADYCKLIAAECYCHTREISTVNIITTVYNIKPSKASTTVFEIIAFCISRYWHAGERPGVL